MSFVKVEKSVQSNAAVISLTQIGAAVFNKGVLDAMAGFSHVEIFWDANTNRIGFKTTKDEANYKFRCERVNQGGISLRSLKRLIGADWPQKTTRYGLEFDAESEMFVIDLNKPLESET